MNKSDYRKLRICLVLSIAVVTPLGFYFKFGLGKSIPWFSIYGAGVLYEVFFILVFFLVFPGKRSILNVPLWVFIITCLLETLQLWQPPFLQAIRKTFLGAVLLGTTFTWQDFPHYILGSTLGAGLIYLFWRFTQSPASLKKVNGFKS